MKYSEKDLRAVDMFSLLLVGLGILFLVLGAVSPAPRYAKSKMSGKKAALETTKSLPGAEANAGMIDDGAALAEKPGKNPAASGMNPGVLLLLLGVVFACCGAALNLGLRRVIANHGEDLPSGYGVEANTENGIRNPESEI